jgi:O-antigen/teichoic acid export membrane protein
MQDPKAPTMAPRRAETGVAIRNAGWVAAQRAAQILVGVIFAILVPRLMGPDLFGQFALITSISMWFALLSGLGAVSLMTRSVAPFAERRDTAGLTKFFSGLLTLRTSTGLAAALLYLAFTMAWLEDVDRIALVCVAAAVFSRTTANICFALFLGLNQAARWGLGEMLRRWLTLGFVLVGAATAGLRGAAAGFLLGHVVVLALGLWMSRSHLRLASLWPDWKFLSPFLRTGAYFAGGNLLLSLSQHTGETLVHVSTRQFVEVGHYGVAYGMYIAGAQALWHSTVAFAPLLLGWKERGENEAIGAFLEHLLTWLVVAAVTTSVIVLLVGQQLVPFVLGGAFRPVSPNVAVLAIALVAVATSSVGRLHALVVDRPGAAATAAAIELVTFWTIGLWLSTRYGSYGACLGVLAGGGLNAGYLAWRLRGDVPYSFRRVTWTCLLALVVAPLAWFEVSWQAELLILAGALAAFGGLLTVTGVVSRGDYLALRDALRTSRTPRPITDE